ncbi:hypothetical protein F5Y08DRAFT_160386 [Xylaria arbuscula]|nr:hypothetical protein F5Y08DRAFT_160386 [Xylaria arbuscula]
MDLAFKVACAWWMCCTMLAPVDERNDFGTCRQDKDNSLTTESLSPSLAASTFPSNWLLWTARQVRVMRDDDGGQEGRGWRGTCASFERSRAGRGMIEWDDKGTRDVCVSRCAGGFCPMSGLRWVIERQGVGRAGRGMPTQRERRKRGVS